MALSKHFHPQCVAIIDAELNKDQLFRKIAEISSIAEPLARLSEETIYQGLLEREKQGSTAFGEGVAVPHCNFDEIDSFVVGLIILRKKGADLKAPDRKPVDLCFFIIGPRHSRNEHIQLLSGITQLLNTTDAAARLRKARWADDAFTILVGSDELGKEAVEQTPASMMSVSIQDDSCFEEILELFTAEEDCHVSVFEGNSAGRYLHHLPGFSALWSEDQKTGVRVIQAVMKSSACNNMIRRINAIKDTSRPDAGILIGITELSYWCGGLGY